MQQYNVGVQHQVGHSWGLEADYVGSRGEHMPMFMEINPTTAILTPTPEVGPRLMSAFSLVRPTFPVAKSWYDSLQMSAKLNTWHSLNLLASYTLGHSEDHTSGLNIGTDSTPPYAVTIGDDASIQKALKSMKGYSLFDARNRFVMSVGYQLPTFATQRRLVNMVLGNWQLNGIFQVQSGFPFTVNEPDNVSLTSESQRPNLTCDPNAGAPHIIGEWFNTSCVQRLTIAANAGEVGDEGRNVVRGPGLDNTDFSLFKNFKTVESEQLQFRIETFNLFNHPYFGLPDNTLGSPTFGAITNAADGRIVQLAAKYMF